MKRTANALRRVGAVLASTLNIGLFDATEYGEFCENCCEYGVPSQKLGHLGQSLLAGICEICGLPVVID